MSDKFFFKGRKTPKPKHESFGYNTKRSAKIGTEARPLNLRVNSEVRQAEIAAMVAEQQLFANISVQADCEEDIAELNSIINKPISVNVTPQPQRNAPCICGSGQKFKKCCGK